MRIHELVTEADVQVGKHLYHATGTENFENMLRDGTMGTHKYDYFSMTADPEYAVMPYNNDIQIILDAQKVKTLPTFEKHVEDWESEVGADDWAKAEGDWESEYRVEGFVPLDYIVAVRIEKDKINDAIAILAERHGVKLISEEGKVLRKEPL